MLCGYLDEHPEELYNIRSEDIYCYTFEAPKGVVSTNKYVSYNNIHNIVLLDDIVPLVAMNDWGFKRYNEENDIYYPNMYVCSDYYTELRSRFEKNLNSLCLSNSETNNSNDHTDFSAFLNNKNGKVSGDSAPMYSIYVDSTKQKTEINANSYQRPRYEIIREGIHYFSELISRNQYVQDYQFVVMKYMSDHMDYSNNRPSDVDTVIDNFTELLKESMFAGIITDAASEKSSNMSHYLAIALSNKYYISAVKQAGHVVIDEIASDYYSTYGRSNSDLIDTLSIILKLVLDDVAEGLRQNNYSKLNLLYSFIDCVAINKGYYAHQPVMSLAWLTAMDQNYGGDNDQTLEYIYLFSKAYRKMKTNCPVDVHVYSEGVEVLSIIGDEVNMSSTLSGCVNGNGEKVVYLPSDGDFDIELVPYDDGNVNISISEINAVTGEAARLENYYDIQVKTGNDITVSVPQIPEAELTTYGDDGSSVDYTVIFENSVLIPDDRLSGETVEEQEYEVSLVVTGQNGLVSGAGTFMKGSFARLEASCPPGIAFDGWYRNGEKLSDEEVYRFAVKEDTEIEARFSAQNNLLPGDVNADETVNWLDLLILSRYLSDWDGYWYVSPAANLNGDDTIDVRDRMILSRYLAEWPGYAEIVER